METSIEKNHIMLLKLMGLVTTMIALTFIIFNLVSESIPNDLSISSSFLRQTDTFDSNHNHQSRILVNQEESNDNVTHVHQSRILVHKEGESNVHIDGRPFPLENITDLSSLWIVPIRFVGPSAFGKVPDPVGAFRCELFASLTLPSLMAAINNPPPKTTISVVFVNASEISEPTCAKVIQNSIKILGNRLKFSSSCEDYINKYQLKEDLLFVTRFDSDDAIGPDTLLEIHRTFTTSKVPIGIISPFWGNLWYPSEGEGDCGQMIYCVNFQFFKRLVFERLNL